MPRRLEFRGTVVGGLSGLDYDAARDEFVSESDDKSASVRRVSTP